MAREPLKWPEHEPNADSWNILGSTEVTLIVRAICKCGNETHTFTAHVLPSDIFDVNGQSLQNSILAAREDKTGEH